MEFDIDEVCPKGDSYPIIVNFQNGYPAEDFSDEPCELLQHRVTGKKTLATEINNILYAGEEYEEQLGKTLVLARNRTTGRVRLIEVENIDVKAMIKSDIDTTDLPETSFVDLGRKFGSKRHKQKLEQYEKLKVSEEVVTEQLKNVSYNVSQDQLDLSSYNKTDADEFYIPPVNREALNVEDVYMLKAILTPEEYDTIFAELDSSDYKSGLYPYIKEILSDNWSKEQTVLAVLASTLLFMHNMTMKTMSVKKFVACPYSATLDKYVLKEFFVYSAHSRTRPSQYKDKAMCHAIVFIFLINNCKLDIESFCKHTKMTEKTATTKINMTGGWVLKQGSKKIAVLKVPLNKTTNKFTQRKSNKF